MPAETAVRSRVVFVGAIELLVDAIGFAFGIEVLEYDDGALIQDRFTAFFDGGGVIGDGRAVVGWKAVR